MLSKNINVHIIISSFRPQKHKILQVDFLALQTLTFLALDS